MNTPVLGIARAALALALTVVMGAAAAQDREAPRVSADRDGRTQVVVDGDCVVNFNARGERTGHSADCRDGQLRRAERADARHREERVDSEREPRITMQADGGARVALGRDCEVGYDREGRRQTWAASCGAQQLARADQALAEFLRERQPRITLQQDGQMRVEVGRDCALRYDAAGRRRAQDRGCGDAEVASADRAVAAHLRTREPQVTMLQAGLGRVVVGRDCEVNYGRDGRRLAQSKGCSGSDVTRADRSMADYRRQQGLDRTPGPGVATPAAGRGGAGDERPGRGQGNVQTLANGDGSVTFSNGCVVTYTGDGRRLGALRLCNPGQLGRADELMATYLQLKQAPTGGS